MNMTAGCELDVSSSGYSLVSVCCKKGTQHTALLSMTLALCIDPHNFQAKDTILLSFSWMKPLNVKLKRTGI